VIGLNQLPRLDSNNKQRTINFNHFLSNLDPEKYMTEIKLAGQCNYAFIVIMRDTSFEKRSQIEATLREKGIEFRRGLSGGGNQMRQPFMTQFNYDLSKYPNIEHIHNFSWYIGNYPTLSQEKIDYLLEVLNNI
jgi:CDP-6-deoxy-D-xylo-4-hexulose-3-dehydrase